MHSDLPTPTLSDCSSESSFDGGVAEAVMVPPAQSSDPVSPFHLPCESQDSDEVAPNSRRATSHVPVGRRDQQSRGIEGVLNLDESNIGTLPRRTTAGQHRNLHHLPRSVNP